MKKSKGIEKHIRWRILDEVAPILQAAWNVCVAALGPPSRTAYITAVATLAWACISSCLPRRARPARVHLCVAAAAVWPGQAWSVQRRGAGTAPNNGGEDRSFSNLGSNADVQLLGWTCARLVAPPTDDAGARSHLWIYAPVGQQRRRRIHLCALE